MVTEAAEDIQDFHGHEFGTDYSELCKELSQINYDDRSTAAKALVAALDELNYIEVLSILFSLYNKDARLGEDNIDSGCLGREGIALTLYSATDVKRAEDLPIVMTFLISHVQADPNTGVRKIMLNAGIKIIDKHGKDKVFLLFHTFVDYLNKKV
ncbi:hypothetical protein Ddye_022826 [Dipteronia dyeriana]|uniref:Uncharacterized protein n=1 Tax=Dipteronia dyeriana TaxID=168575 RepID=A0AAD9TSQ7_9ROSI|nr:hypothetical protein Ddye_022826 [Dipteronia dyeriana]